MVIVSNQISCTYKAVLKSIKYSITAVKFAMHFVVFIEEYS